MGENTTLVIKKYTRDRLSMIGSKRQTYDEIINQLIDNASEIWFNRPPIQITRN